MFPFNSPSPPRIEFDYDDPDDYMYPSYDPFEEDLEFDYKIYEDADEALAVIDHRSQRKRYMVGLFPGVNESFLQRDSIPYEHFATTKHKCLDRSSLHPSDVRCCPHWYRCEKPDVTDGDRELETTRILILNLNYSVVWDEACSAVDKQVTVIYDSERLKSILRGFGATKMTIYCPADMQDYPYAVVDFPDIAQSRAAFQQLQGRCLGYSGRHLRVQHAPLYDYTFGGRHTISEDTRDIVVVSLEPDWLRPVQVPQQELDEDSSPTGSPQKNRYSRMVVTKYGRRIQIPYNLC
ncbi:hypothetical protein BDM02DRAFT_3118464 [Thelephora ganbajun]|uniref:Uncharacterized protein n=1 Tax=Thelephora ganbajun TaxID=370292 RepID=A0ACB6ZAF3_THEGA|nr:hypothetical protein BDM02DRAFT_3118464 [Thelephora ganbajun]